MARNARRPRRTAAAGLAAAAAARLVARRGCTLLRGADARQAHAAASTHELPAYVPFTCDEERGGPQRHPRRAACAPFDRRRARATATRRRRRAPRRRGGARSRGALGELRASRSRGRACACSASACALSSVPPTTSTARACGVARWKKPRCHARHEGRGLARAADRRARAAAASARAPPPRRAPGRGVDPRDARGARTARAPARPACRVLHVVRREPRTPRRGRRGSPWRRVKFERDRAVAGERRGARRACRSRRSARTGCPAASARRSVVRDGNSRSPRPTPSARREHTHAALIPLPVGCRRRSDHARSSMRPVVAQTSAEDDVAPRSR